MHEYWFRKTSKEYLWEQMTRPQADYSRFIRLDIVGAVSYTHLILERLAVIALPTTVQPDGHQCQQRQPLLAKLKVHAEELNGVHKLSLIHI